MRAPSSVCTCLIENKVTRADTLFVIRINRICVALFRYSQNKRFSTPFEAIQQKFSRTFNSINFQKCQTSCIIDTVSTQS